MKLNNANLYICYDCESNAHLSQGAAPTSSRLNAVDQYLVVCVFFVFGKSLGGEMIRHSVYVHHVHHVHHHYG